MSAIGGWVTTGSRNLQGGHSQHKGKDENGQRRGISDKIYGDEKVDICKALKGSVEKS